MGTVTLNKEQALNFVRTRKDVGSQMNLSRMERHKEYLTGLAEALTAKVSDSETFAAELYGELDEYMVTDCTFKVLSSLLQRCAHYEMAEVFSLEGENVLGDEFYEFYADQEKLETLILERFYAPK
jgi:anionic cell wall polymer biosynthesis LytR-Cps2A-Psr (LCP) family protein